VHRLNSSATTAWSTKTFIREHSAGDFPDPARAVALRTSRRIDPAARLRRLFDRRKTGTLAGPALALDAALFGLFHFRSRKPVRSSAPILGRIRHSWISNPSAPIRVVISSIFRPWSRQILVPAFCRNKAAPPALEEPNWGRRRSDRSQTQTAAASLSAPARALVHAPAVSGGFSCPFSASAPESSV
jgi:hypothetical protein